MKKKSFSSLFIGKTINMMKNKELGISFKTVGCQEILQCIDINVVKQTGMVEARIRIWFDIKVPRKMNLWG